MADMSRTKPFLSTLAINIVVAGLYVATGTFGLSLAFVHSSVTAVWPPTGISLAALLVFGARVWPGILLGAFIVNESVPGNVLTAMAIAMGNTLEALAGT